MRPPLAAAIALPLALWAGPAAASGFDAPNVGSQLSGPVTRDAAAVHHNPGQLGYLARPELSFGLGVIVGAVGYERQRRGAYQYEDNLDFAEPIDPENLDPSKTGTASKASAVPVGPVFDVFVAIPAIPERLTFGLGVYIPYAAILDLPHDGAQRFQAQSVSLISAHATLSAGLKLHDVISIGAGVSYVLSYMQLSKVQDFAAVDTFAEGLAQDPISQDNDFGVTAPSTVRELGVLARQIDIERGLSHGVSFNAGVALRPTDKLDLALVYQHGSKVRLDGRFTLNMDDEFFTQDLAAQGLQYSPVVQGDAHIEFSLPKRLTLGAGYWIHDKFSLDGLVSYVFWQDFDEIAIRLSSPGLAQPTLGIGDVVDQGLVRDWKGTVHTELWGRIRPIDRLVVSVLAGYQSSASPDSTVDMASPDGNRLIFGAGVGWTFSETFSLFGDFEGQALIPREVVASDFDLGNGRYNLFIGSLSVHGQVRFRGRGMKQAGKKETGKGASSQPAPAAEPPPTPNTAPAPVQSEPVDASPAAPTPAASDEATPDSSRPPAPPLPPPPPA